MREYFLNSYVERHLGGAKIDGKTFAEGNSGQSLTTLWSVKENCNIIRIGRIRTQEYQKQENIYCTPVYRIYSFRSTLNVQCSLKYYLWKAIRKSAMQQWNFQALHLVLRHLTIMDLYLALYRFSFIIQMLE